MLVGYSYEGLLLTLSCVFIALLTVDMLAGFECLWVVWENSMWAGLLIMLFQNE